jgi:hypothetical protein
LKQKLGFGLIDSPISELRYRFAYGFVIELSFDQKNLDVLHGRRSIKRTTFDVNHGGRAVKQTGYSSLQSRKTIGTSISWKGAIDVQSIGEQTNTSGLNEDY